MDTKKLEELRARREEREGDAAAADAALPSLREAAEAARTEAILSGTAEAKAAAAKADATLDKMIEKRDEAARDLEILDRAIAKHEAEAERLERARIFEENERKRAVRAGAGANLERLIAAGAPGVRRWCALVLAREAVRGRPAGNFPITVAEWIGGTFRHSGSFNITDAPADVVGEASAILARIDLGEVIR